ncbi:MAG: methylamine utilization protein MauE [Desulfovibrio sp.]|nr:methylamine utilization protein MauE [Desulfovibrio sp.]MBI4960964.1 methylamine utilization protein MauE [Desulfovibrio sp.]
MGNLFYHLARTGLAVAFLVAGAIKLARPEVFAVTIKAFGVLPASVVEPLSLVLPCLEILAALLLFFEVRGGLTLTAGLLVIFISVLVYALGMGLDIDCGCYGPSDPEREAFGSIRQALWRDSAMCAAVAYLYWWNVKSGRRGRFVASAKLRSHI